MKKRILSMMLALGMLLGMVGFAAPVRVEADNLSTQLAQTRAKAAELKKQLAEVRARKQSAMDQKDILDQRNTLLMEEIDMINRQIAETTTQIADTEEKEQAQYELFCRQVREEEERGVTSYWSVLFKATGFADLLSRLDFVNEIMDYGQAVIRELRQLRVQLAEQKTNLETQKTELDAAQAELAEQLEEANALVAQLASEENAAQRVYDAEAAAAAKIEKEIKAAEERARLANVAAGNSGGYIWPTNATRLITSPVGFRSAATTNYIGSTNHRGVDIGAAWGTNILAAKAGTVILAGWNGGYGNCVIIQHGSGGYYTVYGHMSRILVSLNQTVAQGQVIGLVGNTGNSNGAHIHFEIHEGGQLKDPLNYLSGWIRYGW
ncbi:MAG: peptidoglycan DD-metalloendopeptidase family protein [Oscillospiraceae bacterium]|nr:peptidoglycan DD-metalloendopeptidase family protein [Oscillospiraceae bacterium]